jgi:hypothetical protein
LHSYRRMADQGSSVTLIFYAIDRNNISSEPFLNIAAAVAQWSSFTHVEVAIGESAGANGEMRQVLRVFNDSTGVELTERTGRNPSYQYLQLGCSKNAEAAMLAFARRQVGKPFSGTGMARSLIYPRVPDGRSWFCAELVAAALQHGGLMSAQSNPGAATPESLYRLYKARAATTANPFTLRNQFGHSAMGSGGASGVRSVVYRAPAPPPPPQRAASSGPVAAAQARSSSPPRAGLRVLGANGARGGAGGGLGGGLSRTTDAPLTLSLSSLNVRR